MSYATSKAVGGPSRMFSATFNEKAALKKSWTPSTDFCLPGAVLKSFLCVCVCTCVLCYNSLPASAVRLRDQKGTSWRWRMIPLWRAFVAALSPGNFGMWWRTSVFQSHRWRCDHHRLHPAVWNISGTFSCRRLKCLTFFFPCAPMIFWGDTFWLNSFKIR